MAIHQHLDRDEQVKLLMKRGDTGEQIAGAPVQQMEERGYNPPSRQRILEWQRQLLPDDLNPPTMRSLAGSDAHEPQWNEGLLHR